MIRHHNKPTTYFVEETVLSAKSSSTDPYPALRYICRIRPLLQVCGFFQHPLDENTIPSFCIIDKYMGHSTYDPPILNDRRTTHALYYASALFNQFRICHTNDHTLVIRLLLPLDSFDLHLIFMDLIVTQSRKDISFALFHLILRPNRDRVAVHRV